MFPCIPSMDNCKDSKSSLRVCGRKSDKTSDLHTTLRTQCRRTVRWLDSGLSEVRYPRIYCFFSKYNPVTSEETSDKQTQYFAKNEECRETVFTEPNL